MITLRAGYAVVVDDEPANRDFLERLMQMAGFKVSGAGSAAEALAAARAVPRLALALVDQELPDASGLEVIKTLRGENAEALLVMATMHDHPSLIERAFDAGVDVFLVKPHGFMELYRRLLEVDENINSLRCLIIDQYGPRPYKGKKVTITEEAVKPAAPVTPAPTPAPAQAVAPTLTPPAAPTPAPVSTAAPTPVPAKAATPTATPTPVPTPAPVKPIAPAVTPPAAQTPAPTKATSPTVTPPAASTPAPATPTVTPPAAPPPAPVSPGTAAPVKTPVPASETKPEPKPAAPQSTPAAAPPPTALSEATQPLKKGVLPRTTPPGLPPSKPDLDATQPNSARNGMSEETRPIKDKNGGTPNPTGKAGSGT